MDEELRRLERRSQETGVVVDEAAVLLHRLRSGALSRGALQVASHLGHEAALLIESPVAEPAELADVHLRARGLVRWGQSVCVRFCMACAEAVVARRGPAVSYHTAPVGRVLRVAGEWLDCPCDEHARVAHDLAFEDTFEGQRLDDRQNLRRHGWARPAVAAAANASLAHEATGLALALSANALLGRASDLFARVAPEVARWALERGRV